MKPLETLFILCALLGFCWAVSDKCLDSSTDLKEFEEDCSKQEYTSYTECIRRKRTKRNADCEEECDDCDGGGGGGGGDSSCGDCNCNYCSYHECNDNCNSCCSSQPPPCSSFHCCHKTCNTQCRSYDCRRRCKKTCHEKIKDTVTNSNSNSNIVVTSNSTIRSLHNITTVINLHNIINNTNIIDMPVQVNNTNINNITIHTPNIDLPPQQIITIPPQMPPPPSQLPPIPQMPLPPIPQMPPPQFQLPPPQIQMPPPQIQMPPPQIQMPPPPQQQPCCKIIEPRQCTPTSTYPFQRCFHIRRHHCGELCTSQIMHAQPHQICDQEAGAQSSCQQQITYLPQPQPRCFATSSWPFVNCRLNNYASSNCEGCYGGGYKDHSSCASSCFDQGGYDSGPLIRPGPFYQPSYGFPPNMGMDFGGMNGNGLFGNPGAFAGVPNDNQFGIVQDTGHRKRESMASDKVEVVHEPVGRGYRSLEMDLESSQQRKEHLVYPRHDDGNDDDESSSASSEN